MLRNLKGGLLLRGQENNLEFNNDQNCLMLIFTRLTCLQARDILNFLCYKIQPPLITNEDIKSYHLLNVAVTMGDGAREIIDQLVILNPAALFDKNDKNEYPVDIACLSPLQPNLLDLLLTLMSKYQMCQVEKYLVKGKFTVNCNTLERIISQSNDENILRCLDICWKHSTEYLMLHAASNCKVNLTFLQTIISRYERCVFNKDANGDIPLHFALKTPKRSFYWHCGLRDIACANPSAIDIRDNVTGLLPFMLSAITRKDIDSTFQLLNRSPHLLRPEFGRAYLKDMGCTLSKKKISDSKRLHTLVSKISAKNLRTKS